MPCTGFEHGGADAFGNVYGVMVQPFLADNGEGCDSHCGRFGGDERCITRQTFPCPHENGNGYPAEQQTEDDGCQGFDAPVPVGVVVISGFSRVVRGKQHHNIARLDRKGCAWHRQPVPANG